MTNLKIADFNDFVMLAGDKIVTDSRRVANAFDKRHGDVLRAVDRLDCGDEFWRRNFASRDYIDDRGKRWRLVEMTKDGFMFLVMGFTGKQAGRIKVAFIDASTPWPSTSSSKPSAYGASTRLPWLTTKRARRWPASLVEG